MFQSQAIKSLFAKSKPPTEEPVPIDSAARCGRGGRQNPAGRGRGKRDYSAAEQQAASRVAPPPEQVMADALLTVAQQKEIIDVEKECNVLPDKN
jgi:hypothetical protein